MSRRQELLNDNERFVAAPVRGREMVLCDASRHQAQLLISSLESGKVHPSTIGSR